MRNLSKSKIIACRQCPKRMWLEIHKPELRDDSGSQMAFDIGNEVGRAARQAFDPEGKGALVDVDALGHAAAIEETKRLLAEGAGPIFEAGISAVGGLAYADVMLPDRRDGVLRWRMIEVKSSTSVKDYQRDDIAVQAYLAKEAGIPLVSVSLAYINRDFFYFGCAGYEGLFKLVELGDEAADRHEEVKEWFTKAHEIAGLNEEPDIETGDQCHSPFSCGFLSYCNRDKVSPEYPLSSLPGLRQRRREAIEDAGADDLREAPDHLLNEMQQRVKHCSVTGEVHFDAAATAAKLAPYGYPARFLDFETIAFAVPRWDATRPYQQIPFQFSLHTLQADGELMHHEFLDLSGNEPSDDCARELVRLCGSEGPIYAYNAGFEARVISEMANQHYPSILGQALRSIEGRLVDLLPIARRHYYHPIQHGSWSLKALLPAVCPDLSYDGLEGVQDGSMAQTAYVEAITPGVSAERKESLRRQLHDYCQLDTMALVRLYQLFKGEPYEDDDALNDLHDAKNVMEDGAICIDRYEKSKLRVMWILKQNIDYEFSNYSDQLLQNLDKVSSSPTWRRLAHASHGLLTGLHDFDAVKEQERGACLESMISTAIVNVNKELGGSRSSDSSVHEGYATYKDLVKEQIEELTPDVMVVCMVGTNENLKPVVESIYKDYTGQAEFKICGNSKPESANVAWSKVGEKLFLWAYHPAYTHVTDADYFNGIMNAYNEAKNS